MKINTRNGIILSATCLMAGCSNDSNSSTKNVNQPRTEQKNMSSNVITSKSGLKKEILTAAPEGAQQPKPGQLVTVHYTGWLENADGSQGAQFDSSVKRGQPFQFNVGVGQVIRGWDEGVLTMKVGEKARFTIPAAIGYGARGAGNVIPANATLIFDVELISIG